MQAWPSGKTRGWQSFQPGFEPQQDPNEFCTKIYIFEMSLMHHYYVIITSLLRHYYVIITSLRHYYSLLHSHYYILLPYYYVIITSLLHH